MNSAKLSKSIMIRKIITLLLSCSLVFGSVSFSFASSVTPSNLTPYLQSNSGYYWINPNNGYSTTVSNGTKLVDMIGQLGGNLSQGIFNILSKLSNTGRIYLYNYSGTNTSYNAGSSLGDLVGYGFQYLTQTNGLIYDKVDGLLSGVNSIKGYVDGVEGYIDGLETGLTSVNTNLTNIKSDTNSIKGYIDGLEAGQNDIVNAIGNISGTDLSNVHSYLNNIASDVELNEINTSGIDDTLDYIADKMFLSSSGTLADDIENILYSNRDILNGFGYSYGDTLKDGITGVVNVGSDIVSNVSDVFSVNSTISAISSDLRTIATSQMAIQSTISAINTGIHSDTTDLNSKLQTLTDNYNLLDWVDSGSISGVSENNDDNYLERATSRNTFYVRGSISPSLGNVFKIDIPIACNVRDVVLPDFEFGIYNGSSNYESIECYILSVGTSSINQCTEVLIYAPFTYSHFNLPFYLKVSSSSSLWYRHDYLTNCKVQSLGNNTLDNIQVSDNIFLYNIVQLFRDAKFMFFDDDTIQAKKDNVSQTSAVIDGFTADGDASASASDFGIVKDSVSSVKSGVDTNVSASEALNIFNNSDGYGFWSTDCLNALDTTNNNRLLRSRGSDTPLYDKKLQSLYNAMGVNND